LSYLPKPSVAGGVRKGRVPEEGYSRAAGLQFGDVRSHILADPVFQYAAALANGRSILDERCGLNLFLLFRFYLAALPPGNIIEFGSYKGGSAIFMAALSQRLGLNAHVWALDTFSGMPPTDKTIDNHTEGDFSDAQYEELSAYIQSTGLRNITLVRGRFEDTVLHVRRDGGPFRLAHIDCDINPAVAFAYDSTRGFMVPGGYLVFDDPLVSSCLGALEAVEEFVIRRDGLHAEQAFPHLVFRAGLA
jgi:predicted O-methyltransferase YrrM